MAKWILCLLLFCYMFTSLSAQEVVNKPFKEEMNVDMPDETEETDLIDAGQVQLETAILYNHYREGKRSVIGQGLLRYGVSERLEIRALIEDGQQRDRYISETVQSTYPLAIGTKVALLKDKKILPDITFIAYLKLPFTNRSRAQSIYWSPMALLAFQHKFADEKIKVEYNAGIQQNAFDKDWQWLGNASLHYKITQSLEAFGEYYAKYSSGEMPMHNLGGGLALQIGNQIEIYLSGGSTIDHPDSNHFFATGIAIRTP